MPTLSLTPAPTAAAAYCRQARRLRAQFGGDAARLQGALRDLAGAEDRKGQPPAAVAERLDLRSRLPGPAALFSSRVAAAVTDGVLRFTARKDLLREASRMGIDRFQANLLIAAVQHHHETPSPAPTAYTLNPATSRLPFGVLVFALALQASIASAVWWVVHS